MLKQRVITAVILAVLFLTALFQLSPLAFSLVVAVVVIYAAWEWSDLSGIENPVWRVGYLLLMALLLLAAALQMDMTLDGPPGLEIGHSLLVATTPWWALALLWVQGYPSSALLWGHKPVRAIMGAFVLVPTWVAVVLLSYSEHGPWLILLVVMIVALADIGAYFSGRKFGRHSLASNVSPKKTLEGLLGGILTNLLLVFVLGLWFQLAGKDWLMLLAIVMVTTLASVLGDLLESMIKRHRGVKDSGKILPGHGGVMDRVDSITAALPLFTLIFLSSGIQF